MDYMLICGDEIALEGLDGCPPIKLWENLQKRTPPFPIKIDDGIKSYLWTGIVESLDVKFYSLETPLPHIFSNDIVGLNRKKFNWNLKQESDGWTIDFFFNSFHMVHDGEIIGSCPEYERRTDITSEIRSVSGKCLLSLQQALDRWGDHLVIVASQELRQKALIEDDIDPTIALTPLQFCLLEHVGQARTNGRLQRFMAIHLNIDAKHLFFILKKLSQEMGLIKKQKSVICNHPASNVISNFIRLKRFCTPPRHPFDNLGAEMCEFLATQPNQRISFTDLQKHYKNVAGFPRYRTIKKVCEHLTKLGHVKAVIIRDPCLSKYGTQGRERYYVQLVSPLVLKKIEEYDDDDADDLDNDESTNTIVQNPNLVMELPMTKQIYDYIESKGPEGVTNKDISDDMQLFKYDRRAAVNSLESRGNVKRVMTYGGRQSILRYVSLPHLDDNFHTKKIIEEQKKLEAIQDEVSLLAAEEASTASGTPLDSPCPSPVPSFTLTASDRTDKKGSKAVTYRKLKRTNFIVDLLKEKRVIEGCVTIQKAVHEEEEKEGLLTKMDRKVLKRSLTGLIDKGMIKKLTTIIDVKDVSHSVEFYLHSSVNPQDPEVKAAIESSRFRLSGDQLKSEHPKKKLLKAKSTHEEETTEENNPVVWNHDLRFSYGYLAKFPRMQLIHEFMWQAFFGVKDKLVNYKIEYEVEHAGIVKTGSTATESLPNDQTNRNASDVDTDKGEPQTQLTQASTEAIHTEMSQQSNSTAPPVVPSVQESVAKSEDIVQKNKATNTGELTSETHNYGWIGQLQPLPTYDKPIGWVKLNDFLKIMPLSVYCNTVGINRKVDGLDEYYNDPIKIHTAFKDLPDKIRRKLKYKGRYKDAFTEIFNNLMRAGLVMVERPVPGERLQAFVHFSRGAIVLDTSKNYTIGEDNPISREEFPFRQFVFHKFSDVQAFWEDLKYICLRTSYNKKKKNVKTHHSFKFSDCQTELITEDNILPPPGDSLGAAGLDSCLFSHLARNWSFRTGDFMKFRIFSSEKRKSQHDIVAKQEIKKRKTDTGIKAPRPKSKKKRPLKESKASPTKRQKVEESPTPTEKKKSSGTVSVNSHLVAVDDTDKAAMAKKKGMRVYFSPDNDKVLILCKIALEIMGVDNYRDHNLYVQIRNILHEHCPKDSWDKTAPNCRKRLYLLMRNRKNELTVKVCVAEYSSMQEFANAKDRKLPFNETFHSTVKKIMELSKKQVSSLDDTSQLVSSINELHSKYRVRKLAIAKKPLLGYEEPTILGPPIRTLDDIKNSVAKDIIQITCQTHHRYFRASYINRMFDDFDLDEITKAGSELKKAGVIKRQKDNINKTRNMPWKLSAETVRLLDPSPKDFITSSTYDEVAQFVRSCFSAPVSGDNRKIARLTEETICGGMVAACLSLLFTGEISVEFHLPAEILAQTLEPIKQPSQKDKGQGKSKQAFNSKQKKTAMTEQERPGSVVSKELEANESSTKHNDKSPFIKPRLAKAGKSSKGSAKNQQFTDDHDDVVKPSDESDKDGSTVKASKRKNPKTVSFSDDSLKEIKEPLKSSETRSEKQIHLKTTKKKDKNTDKCTTRLRNPFINNQAITHCKFDTTFSVSNADGSLFTPKLKKNNNTKTVTTGTINRPTRTANLPCRTASKPKLMSQGYNTLDTLKVNNCEIILWSRSVKNALEVTKDSHDVTTVDKDSRDVTMVTNDNNDITLVAKDNDNTPVVAKGCHDVSVVAKDNSEISMIANDNNNASVVAKGNKDDIFTVSKTRQPTASDKTAENGTETKDNLMAGKSESNHFQFYPFWLSLEEVLKDAPCLEEYLRSCRHDQYFTDSDENLARVIYDMANESEEVGTTLLQLQQLLLEKPSISQQASWSLDKHIKNMCVNKLLLKVGSFEEHFILPSFAKMWSVTVKKDSFTASESEKCSGIENTTVQSPDVEMKDVTQSTQLVTPSPSTSHEGDTSMKADVTESTQPDRPSTTTVTKEKESSQTKIKEKSPILPSEQLNEDGVSDEMQFEPTESTVAATLVKEHIYKVLSSPWLDTDGQIDNKVFISLLHAVLSAIVNNPGITESSLCKKFMKAVRPVPLSHVLEYLIEVGCITKHGMTATKPSLFSSDVTEVFYFIPVPDCIVTLAKLTHNVT